MEKEKDEYIEKLGELKHLVGNTATEDKLDTAYQNKVILLNRTLSKYLSSRTLNSRDKKSLLHIINVSNNLIRDFRSIRRELDNAG